MKYTIGIDYGTLSARAILVRADDGAELASAEFVYPHGVMDKALPDGTALEPNAAFQHPKDYLDALKSTVSGVLEQSKVSPDAVVGMGIDFTACTMLPVSEDGTPLCFFDEFSHQPQAYAKLWKHHAAQQEADEITEKARQAGEDWLDTYGGKVSSEWLFPKMLETLRKAPEIYHRADHFVEAGDWLTRMLTGQWVCSSCMAGYKGMWNKNSGYPASAFLKTIAPEFETVVGTKIIENVKPTGTLAGFLSQQGSALTGLRPGTAVAVPIIDAHAALPAAGVAEAGKLMLIIGTSACHIVMDEKEQAVSGICGMVRDGVIPGLVAYEAGQTAVGDIFDWFVNNSLPYGYYIAAKEAGVDIFAYLTDKAKALPIGGSGLVAVDWFNGNRTPYADSSLRGAVAGYTLQTTPEELYRCLIESTAFGTKVIVDLYERSGIPVDEVYATGGISQKNPFLMQIYADVLGKVIRVPHIKQAGAMGSAIFAAYAAGCYDSVTNAVNAMVNTDETVYRPNLENTKAYGPLYEKYQRLCDFLKK